MSETRTLVVGDVHGCAGELRRLAERHGPTRILLVGDLFTKGPDPSGVWRFVRETGAQAVLGNHDARMLQVWDSAVAGHGRFPSHRAVRALRGDEALRAWLAALPLFRMGPSFILVHAGLHPREGLGGTRREQALVMRRWPGDSPSNSPFWWQQFRVLPDRPLVIYGHDARRRVQDHRPRTLGLDGGCVYGGELGGYLVEADRVVTEPAGRIYWPVRAIGA